MTLPIEPILPDIVAALMRNGRAVLQAPPGAGKTTLVPLALLDHIEGRIVMLEPRRVAARAAAARMAELLGEDVGLRIGYRMRGAVKNSKSTRIEVVTEGVLTRMLQQNPELPGVGCIIFDEFHERSLQADLGLALVLEVMSALRDDLKLLVMSATLDAEPVAKLMDDAPIITSHGRAYPVEICWAERPLPMDARRGWKLADAVAAQIKMALDTQSGSALVFLPGAGEIKAVADRLIDLPKDVVVRPLYGAMKLEAQRAAIRPVTSGRKVVLATSIAETSLTIDGVRIVIDAGLARRARFDPGSAMSRLVTERVTRAEATQRTGRAGRTAPGMCFRMWTKGEEGSLAAFPLPEIADADLAPMALELACWGSEADELAFLTQPPALALAEARALLADLGCLKNGRITNHGRTVASLPTHPRLAHMLIRAGEAGCAKLGADLAALIDSRDMQRNGADLTPRLRALPHAPELAETRDVAKRLLKLTPKTTHGDRMSAGALLSLAYPDRIALRRSGDKPRYLMSGGKGAKLRDDDALASQTLLVAADLDGDLTEATLRRALPISMAELRELHADRINPSQTCTWSKRHRRVEARSREMLGALALDEQHWRDAPDTAMIAALIDGIRDLGLSVLNWSKAARLYRARVQFVGDSLPDMSDDTLMNGLENWLAPHLAKQRNAEDLGRFDPLEALRTLLDWEQQQRLDAMAPQHFTAPTGSKVALDWSDPAQPLLAIRLQELFGLTTHPVIGPHRLPLRLDLLSPAGRPVQTTSDLPGFWATSYSDVRKDMRGRYPRHPWPEDPANATPTRRVKPRGT